MKKTTQTTQSKKADKKAEKHIVTVKPSSISLPYVAAYDEENNTEQDFDALLASNEAVNSYAFVRRNEYKPLVSLNVAFKKDEILSRYGRENTFGRSFAEKLATIGIDEETYKIIAEHYGVKQNRFMQYIKYYRDQKFNIVLHNGKYISAACI